MDVASMIAINNRNMITMMNALQEVNHIVLFNEVGAIKGKLMDADSQWVKVETPKKGTQLINRNMIRNITFSL